MTSYALRGLDGSGYFELPDFQDYTAGFEFSDIGALTVKYPVTGMNASRLTHLVQVMLLIDGVEADNGRWLLKAIGGNEDNNDAAVLEWTGRSIAQVFEGAIVLGATPSAPAAVPFSGVTPGEILKTLLTQAQARGALTGITHGTFSNTLDSNGIAWGSTYTQTYNAFVKYIDILRDLVNKGLIEFKMVGLDLRVYKADTMGVDRTALSTAVTLRSGLDFSETPFTSTVDSYVSDVYVEGDDGSLQIRTGASTHPFGKQEDSITVSGTADSGSLILAGDAELAARRRTRVEKTRGLKFHDATQFWPLVDYKVSDYIFQQSAGISEKIRIRALTVQGDQSGATGGSVVLNDKFVEQEIRTAQAINSILGGSVAGGPNAPSAGTDSTIPNAPTVTGVASLAFVGADGSPAAVVTVTCAPPATNTDASPFTDLSSYMVRWRYADADVPPNPGEWQQVQGSGSNVVSFSPVRVGVDVEVQALVLDTSNHTSAWSASSTHTTTTDSTPPPVPTVPVASSYLGSLKITWDGQFAAAAPRPTDFRFVEVHVSTSSSFTPDDTTQVATMAAVGNTSVPALTYGVTYYVKLRSVDTYGNKSASTAAATAIPQQATAGDIAPSVIADLTSDPIFIQYFDSDDGVSGWVEATANYGAVSWYNDTAAPTVPGVLRFTDVTWGEWQGSAPFLYDPTALYRMRVRLKGNAEWKNAPACRFYMGFVGYAADRTTKINTAGNDDYGSSHYAVSAAHMPDGEWNEYIAYIGGLGDVGAVPGGGGSWDLPKAMRDGVKYWRPIMISYFDANASYLTTDEQGFEAGIGSWAVSVGGTISQSTTVAYDGTHSLRMLQGGATGTVGAITGLKTGVVAGMQYTASAAFRAGEVGASGCWVAIAWYDASDAYLTESGSASVTDTTTGWTTASITATAPANAVKMRMFARVPTVATGNSHYIDACRLRDGAGDHYPAAVLDIDSFEVYRLDSSITLPDGLLASSVDADTIIGETVIVGNQLIVADGTQVDGYVFTAQGPDGAGGWEEAPVPVAVNDTAPSSPRVGELWSPPSKQFYPFYVLVKPTAGTSYTAATNNGSWNDVPWDTIRVDVPCNGIILIDWNIALWSKAINSGIAARVAPKSATGCTATDVDSLAARIARYTSPNLAGATDAGAMFAAGGNEILVTGVNEAVGGTVEIGWKYWSQSTSNTLSYPFMRIRFEPYADVSAVILQTGTP